MEKEKQLTYVYYGIRPLLCVPSCPFRGERCSDKIKPVYAV